MLTAAVEIVRQAGALALQCRGAAHCAEKHDGTWVTSADHAVEDLVREAITRVLGPGHRVAGEEAGGVDDLAHGLVWLVDPIDGTVNYVRGIPLWGVSLGLLRDGVPVVGVFHMPQTGDLFTGEAGRGASLNGEPIRAQQARQLGRNDLVALNSDALQAYEISTPAMLRNLGSAATHGCYVACGALTAAIFHLWRTWDIAAALCIAREAGAVARYLDGTELRSLADMSLSSEGDILLLGAPCTLDAVSPGIRRIR